MFDPLFPFYNGVPFLDYIMNARKKVRDTLSPAEKEKIVGISNVPLEEFTAMDEQVTEDAEFEIIEPKQLTDKTNTDEQTDRST